MSLGTIRDSILGRTMPGPVGAARPDRSYDSRVATADALRVEHLRVAFQEVDVLRDVSFTLAPGTLTVLSGANGSGKSTLFAAISGFVVPATGAVFVRGMRVSGRTPPNVARAGVRRVLQHPALVPALTALENVVLGGPPSVAEHPWVALWRSAWRAEQRSLTTRAAELLESLGLAAAADRAAGTLSVGQTKLVAFARASLAGGCVFLLDELFTGVAARERHLLVEQVLHLVRGGAAVMCAEHHHDELAEAGARSLHLQDGRLAGSEGGTEEVP